MFLKPVSLILEQPFVPFQPWRWAISVCPTKLIFSFFIPFYFYFWDNFSLCSGLFYLWVWFIVFTLLLSFLLSVQVTLICAFTPEPGCGLTFRIARITCTGLSLSNHLELRWFENWASLNFTLFRRQNSRGRCGFQFYEVALR